jgi:pSer/pThr/pTyr-binding forkhead associated (FHA) protein
VERVIVIEVLDRRGRVRERVRLARLPAFVGRAYTNDVILEDRYASPQHCVIRETFSGELTVEDLGSLNGVQVLSAPPSDSLALRSGDRFRVGETVLRLVEANHPVAPAEPLPADEGGLVHALRDFRLALTVVIASLAIFLLEEYLAAYYDTGFMPVASPALLGLGVLGLWSGIWAFVNRLLTHRFDYLRHLACACLAAVTYLIVQSLAEYAEFLSSSRNLGTSISLGGGAFTLFSLFSAHLAVIPASTRGLRRIWAVAGTSLLLGVAGLLSYTGPEDLVDEIPMRVPIKAVGASLIRPQTTSEFLESARFLREQADDEAEEDR